MKLCLACQQTFSGEGWKCPACGKEPGRKGEILFFAPEFSAQNDQYPSDGFERLAPLEAGNFWFRARNRLIRWAFRKHFAPKGKYLEIGCGTGFVLSMIEREFPELEVHGSEIYENGLAFASRQLERAKLFQMDAYRVPFRDEFDVVGMFDVLEHITDDEKVLDQVHQALVPGGGLILTVPQHAFLWSYVDEFTHHARRYEKKGLVEKVQKAGFQVLLTTSFVSLLLPFMWLSRIRQRKQDRDFDPEAEFKIPPMVNFLLEKILDLERALIRIGLRFPLGGSLLLVARKV